MIQIKTRIVGRYKIEKHKSKTGPDGISRPIPGTKKIVADWFDNIITDLGLNEIGTRSIGFTPPYAMQYCHVGSGSSTPDSADTQLDNLVAASNTTQSSSNIFQTSTSPRYVAKVATKRFASGAAAGTLSEVGMAWSASGGSLFSRALIVDSGGSPTTITVLSDEILDVTYELRIYPPETDSSGTIDLGGVTYDYTARAARIGFLTHWGTDAYGVQNKSTVQTTAYDGAIGPITGLPSGSSDNATTTSEGTYSNNSLEGESSASWGLNDGNIGGIRSVVIGVGWTSWQVEFSAQSGGGPVPKDNTNELTLSVSHSWARGTV